MTKPKQMPHYSRRRKLLFFLGLPLIAILSLHLFTHSRASSFSTPPAYTPAGIVLQTIESDGLEADFFHGVSDKPQKALVLLGGSDGGRCWSYQSKFIQDLISEGFCVLSLPYFGCLHLPLDLRAIPLEYFSKAFHW